MRTNQFEVDIKLEGLGEKFRVLNRDDLADELYTRVKRLDGHQEKWIPDILDLLLHLSEDPVRNSKVEDLTSLRQELELPPRLRWIDFDRGDPFDRNDPVWRNTVFGGYSSEEDGDVSARTIPLVTNHTNEPELPGVPANEKHDLESTSEAEDLISSLKESQFFNNSTGGFVTVDEADLARETIFVLLGLPSSIYWRVGEKIELDRRFVLGHTSHDSLLNFEERVGGLVLRIDAVRHFVAQSQTVPYMQVLLDGIRQSLKDLDWELSCLQSDVLTGDLAGPLTLLNVLQKTTEKAKIVCRHAKLVRSIERESSVQALERLFEFVCRYQALECKDEFKALSLLFATTFRRYLDFLQKSIDEGSLPDNVKSSIPSFLQPASQRLQKISRTWAVLRNLRSTELQNIAHIPDFEILHTDLAPFQDAFMFTINQYIDSQLTAVSNKLKEEISGCLMRDLKILQYVYFARNIALTTAVDLVVFSRFGNGESTWNDRFILTDHVQRAYANLPGINIHSLTVRSNADLRARTHEKQFPVRPLGKMSIVYRVKQPVSTIIPESALTKYQSVSDRLLQLRWAKHCLENCYKIQFSNTRVTSMYHVLLFSINTVYDHFTSYSVETLSNSMLHAIRDAFDIDEMVHVHEAFLIEIEDHCLLSERLSPLNDALLHILALCHELSDIISTSFTITSSRHPSCNDDFSSSGKESDGEESYYAKDGYSGSTNSQPSPSRFSALETRFNKQIAFLIAGLRGVGRVKNSGWDMLAEKLDWEKAKRRREYV